MARKAKSYQNSVIYKITCKDNNVKDVYIGSTRDFINRRCCHKGSCCDKSNSSYNQPKYKFIRDHGGWINWKMIIIEEYPCNNKTELLIRERYHIENNDSVR